MNSDAFNQQIGKETPEITADMYALWERHPVTQAIFKILDERIANIKDDLVNQRYYTDKNSVFSWQEQYIAQATYAQTLIGFKNIKLDLIPEEESADESSK